MEGRTEMKIRRVICGLAIFVGLIGTGCEYLPAGLQPEILGVTPRITGIDLGGVNLAFDMDVRNPYPMPIRAPRFKYNLAVEGMPLASEQVVEGLDLPAGRVGVASLPVRVGYQDLFRVMNNLRNANQAGYELDGAFLLAAAGRDFELPFAHGGTLPILQPPKFSAINFKTPQVTASGARIALDANVMNPNVFAVGFRNLGYSLQIGDIPVGDLVISTLDQLQAGESGQMSFGGQVTTWDAIKGVSSSARLGAVRLLPRGSIDTPYGPVQLHQPLIGAMREGAR
jgi:LEA14-like dessication related protein